MSVLPKENIWSSSGFLIFVNLFPIYGILQLGWNVNYLLYLYWAETVVIGLINVFKLNKTIKEGNFQYINSPDGVSTAFFCLHYFGFMLLYLVFLSSSPFGLESKSNGVSYSSSSPILLSSAFILSLVSITLSHIYSYKTNFIENKEYAKLTPTQVFFLPYGRVFLFHIAAFAAASFVSWIGGIGAMYIIIVIAKTAFDLMSHVMERKQFNKLTIPA